MAKTPYKLSRELYGHTGDVRGLAVGVDGSIVSVSRDKTAILWKFQDGQFTGNSVVMKGHNNFVSSVCILSSTAQYPNGLIITGSNDSNICMYNPGDVEPVQKFKAHENTVCALKSSSGNSFLSSSWDITAKLWNSSNVAKPEHTYIGHTAAVWCVADLPNGSIVTGSADKNVIVYLRNGEILHKLEGHTDCVRDIAIVKDNEFLTCANDAVIKHWNAFTGDCLGNYYGHSNYIYSVSAFLDGHLVASSGEDKTVKVWRDGKVDQTIELPARSVWCVRLLPNQDIVCGASDNLVRIFTADPERYADSETMQKFEETVANSMKIVEEELGLKNVQEPSALHQPGKKDGETKLVREGTTVKAYNWSQSEMKWIFIGDVVGGNPANSSKTLHNGIEYDYVFSVDIQDGVPPLKLPYNKGQDPWVAAQKFIDDNQLSQMFLEQVANFIIKNSTPAPVVNNSSQFYDPFTGGSRYIPSSSERVTAQPAPTSSDLVSNSSVNTVTYIPMTNYLRLEQASLDSILGKLKEFNAKPEVQCLAEDKLESIVKLATNAHQEALMSGAISYLMSLLNWPDEFVFPALDIARLAVLQKSINEQFCTDEFLSLIGRYLQKQSTNQMLTFRILANMFCHETGERLALRCKDDVLNAILAFSSPGNKNLQVAVSTYVLNLAVALNKTSDSATARRLFDATSHLLGTFDQPEAIFRLLVGLGTLLTAYRELVKYAQTSSSLLNQLKVNPSSSDATQLKIAAVSKKLIDLIY
ncbi:phospholipase A-2-activating protein isoform X2 [Phymastichus coffea]|uniref:phospholipase A-2-activating protein isoform X2 n=1 Tax=Phymastichus coffea TaxID=108790 RepID=UPI00273A8628|nr:phospholipase A-2-activating protein isoform X2 [Phymastichus coffea]